MMFRKMLLAGVGVGVLLAAGCQSSASLRRDFARTPLGPVDQAAVLAAGEQVMRAHFDRVSVKPELGRLTAEADYYRESGRGDKEVITRRRAIMELVHRDGGYWAYVRVPIERSSTSVYRMFGSQPGDRDYTVPTPMESGETVRASQRHVWQLLRRDYDLERELLSKLRERLDLPPLEGPPAVPPAAPH
jgi:hypothetical protein